MKWYFIALLELERCLPLTDRVPSDQPIAFYKCLLDGRAIESGLGDAAYKAVLRDQFDEPPPPPPLEHAEVSMHLVLWSLSFCMIVSMI